MTKEHVVPNFIYKQNPQAKFGYNPKADQFISAEVQIKDVCATCNNEHLGKLDRYGSQFFDQNEIGHLVKNEKRYRVAYDYALLSRFLLKVTFNCMRFKGDDTSQIKLFSKYILYGIDHPVDLDLRLCAEIIRCHKITDADRCVLAAEARAWKYIPPHTIRIGPLLDCANTGGLVLARYVFLNNFCFYLMVGKRDSAEFSEMRRLLRQSRPFASLVDPRTSAVTIKVSSSTSVTMYEDTALGLIDKWMEYMRRTKAKG